MRNLGVFAIIYLGLLPVSALIYFGTEEETASGLTVILPILFIDLLLCGIIGMVAMTGSYLIYASTGDDHRSVRWMTFGVDLLFWAAVGVTALALGWEALRRLMASQGIGV